MDGRSGWLADHMDAQHGCHPRHWRPRVRLHHIRPRRERQGLQGLYLEEEVSSPERILRCMQDADRPMPLLEITAQLGLSHQETARAIHRLLERGSGVRVKWGVYELAGPGSPGYVPRRSDRVAET